MKQVEKIWAELSAKESSKEVTQESTELSAEEVKVELGLMDDFKQQAKESFGAYTRAIRKVEQLAKEGINDLNVAGKALVRMNPMKNQIEQQAKDLGVDLPREVEQQMAMVKDQIQEVDALIKQLSRLS